MLLLRRNTITMKKVLLLLLTIATLQACCGKDNTVCIYGGTSAAVTAAYSAAHKGSRVTVICPDNNIGGMTSGGLGQTDIGNKQAVVGLARKFYRKLGAHYGKFEQWLFEPHVAESILMEFLAEKNIVPMQGWYLDSVKKDGPRIQSITCSNRQGKTISIKADQFIDCSYEGDLMAKAGVSYRVGREDNSEYGETYNGSQLLDGHQFPDGVDPFIEKGNPASGLLWGISGSKLKPDGCGDNYVQAYNFRICLTDRKDNMIPLQKPERYSPDRYELLARVLEADPAPSLDKYFIWSMMPNRKTDINNRGPFSTDMIGMNHDYPEADWQQRERIIEEHKDYTLGLLYFYMTDPRVPAEIRNEMRRWGLPRDEYVNNGHWTPQIYVREARRLVGEYVATQADCEGKVRVSDGVGYAAYQMDSHNCERIVIEKDGKMMVKNEGNVEIGGGLPYPVSYRSLTPRREECVNLLVPVCVSASHIAYGSIRMEPVFMGLGQAAGLAAAMAGKGNVQDIDVCSLQTILSEDPYLDGTRELLIDEDSEYIQGKDNWDKVNWGGYGYTYLSYNGAPEANRLKYIIPSCLDGDFEIYAFQQRYGCGNTVFEITLGDEIKTVEFKRSSLLVEGQTSGEWVSLGTYTLGDHKKGWIRFLSQEPDIHADAILLIKK